MNSGNYEDASLQFEKTMGYKNSSSLLTECEIKPRRFDIGDILQFGSYNGDPIRWIVIENDGSKTKVISYDAVAEQPYNNVQADNFVQ